MAEQFENEVTVTDIQGNTTLLLDGNNSRIFALGTSKIVLNGNLGTLSLHDNNRTSSDEPGRAIIHASAEDSTIVLRGRNSQNSLQPAIQLQGAKGTVTLGGFTDGSLGLFKENVFSNTNDLSTATIHASGRDSFIQLRNANRENTIFLGGQDGTILLGDHLRLDGENGSLTSRSIQLRNAAGANSIFIDGQNSTILLGDHLRLDGENGSLTSRSIQLRNAAGANSIFIDGQNSTILLGDTLRLNGNTGNIQVNSVSFSDGSSLSSTAGSAEIDNRIQALENQVQELEFVITQIGSRVQALENAVAQLQQAFP